MIKSYKCIWKKQVEINVNIKFMYESFNFVYIFKVKMYVYCVELYYLDMVIIRVIKLFKYKVCNLIDFFVRFNILIGNEKC